MILEPVVDIAEEAPEAIPAAIKTQRLASLSGDISDEVWFDGGDYIFSDEDLRRIGNDVVEDYQRDLSDRKEWADTAKAALDAATQTGAPDLKNFPWRGASNLNYPLLTTAALQFNARAYPAIVKGDEAVTCKVVGRDNGRPMIGPDGQPVFQAQGMPVAMTPQGPAVMTPAGPQPLPEGAQPEPVWRVPPGGKANRAQRVREYMNTTIFYRMKDWEADTDALLIQTPIVGCSFRKVWYDPARDEHCSKMIPALRIVVPCGVSSLETSPRISEEIPDVYPHTITERMKSRFYRIVDLADAGDAENKQSAAIDRTRMLIEQQRLMDIDGDGIDEPYVITVDKATSQVLRIEPNFSADDIHTMDGSVVSIERRKFYVKYGFFPDPKGGFYDMGLGHLLKQVGEVVNTLLNQLIDSGTAATAGGGFIASGVRLQSRGGGNVVRFAPGEYRVVDGATGGALREAIVDRNLPQPSSVSFQVLDLILGAARDIAGVKDVITGDASNNGQVGTTLALIEQGLQVYNAVYKRVYRALKEEFQILFGNMALYATDNTANDYREVLDDDSADFAADFNAGDMDIRPVTDPTSVTKMQKMARSQYLMQFAAMPFMNGAEIVRRALEAADVEEIDELFAPPQPPDEGAMAKLQAEVGALQARAAKDHAKSQVDTVDAQIKGVAANLEAFQAGQLMGHDMEPGYDG